MVKEGYKQTEVGVIPEDWKVVKLQELTSLVTNGFVGKATTHYTDQDDGITYIQGYNVEANSFNFNGIKKVTPEFHKIHQKSCLKKDDLLTIQTGEVGLTTIIPERLVGSNCHALIISRFRKEKAYPWFYAHYFNSPMGRLRLRDLEVGTTMKHINVADLLAWEIPYPTEIQEQRLIAQALSDVDALIAALDKAITKKRAIKTATMQQLLTGKKRLPGFGEGKGYQKTEVGIIPEDWDVTSLGDFTDKVGSGITPTGGSRVYKESGRPFIRSQNVGWGFLQLDDLAYIDEETHQTFAASEIRMGDVLLNITGASIGRSCIADDRITKGNVNQHVCIIRTKQNHLDTSFLGLFLLSKDGQKQIDSFQAGGNREGLNFGQIRSFKIRKPRKVEEQRAIATVLSDMDAEIAALETRLAKTQTLKQGMMQALLTGRVRLV